MTYLSGVEVYYRHPITVKEESLLLRDPIQSRMFFHYGFVSYSNVKSVKSYVNSSRIIQLP